ncbi:exodeoxyribonuclease VII small subunit [Flavilitoribacter nigricans]|uniref:Exodeoxyribonuclease VII small subunit n=1 Tax=Flavilitoribacter nigricans (strain ATCC 23147 / DSM 23189 / NBRC 102662 / NCIMB 1420 / SS-2) TaxID=1122177 RepID=A0A2D0NFH4_FLAN2|nr:exodeoxyribonuclease VII small subunit [Flavilitoribacter nigricans]PHN06919.1 exodeoxyribonuclease VII small subunit [Flavilitoribacter nigricans DSM 23189 = NBRC 102662]
MTYEAAMGELQDIVDALQENTLGIDDLSERLQRAAELINFCRQKLRSTEEEIQGLFSDQD